jgi:hypothetical protein
VVEKRVNGPCLRTTEMLGEMESKTEKEPVPERVRSKKVKYVVPVPEMTKPVVPKVMTMEPVIRIMAKPMGPEVLESMVMSKASTFRA